VPKYQMHLFLPKHLMLQAGINAMLWCIHFHSNHNRHSFSNRAA